MFRDSPLKRGDKGVCKIAATPPSPMVCQASSPGIMMTNGEACPTNEGNLRSPLLGGDFVVSSVERLRGG